MKKCIPKKCTLIYLSILKQGQANMNMFNELLLFRFVFSNEQKKTLEQFM